MALNPLFLNQCFDKNRLKNLITWSLLTVGERQTIETVENLKALGFEFATQAGVSLSVDDLKTPPEKLSLVSQASQQVEATQQAYQRGSLTAIEKLQQLVDTWHRTSETLKQTVVNHFQSTDKLSPVYMMAFSGARGNISQVRQLAGMRGLMADPQGQIIGFPIRSNFREGLTLTEYMISCYGARKGLVDTALRTADAGYLTRRLVDVSQHMIVKAATCATPRGILLKDLRSSTKVVLPLRERLIGRVLAEDVIAGNELHDVVKGSYHPSISTDSRHKPFGPASGGSNAAIGVSAQPRQPGLIASRNQEISAKLASRIVSCRDAVVVRSPLTCSIRHGVCQLCYGWSLSEGRLVTLGEAVGIIAAQSIGEPGTQLTMRTFHTGGVFSGDVMAEVRAPHDGVVDFPQPLQGLLIRTSHGKIAFLTKAPGSLLLRSSLGLAQDEEGTLFSLEPLTVVFVRQHEKVARTQLIAEFSSMGAEMNETIEAKRTLFSEMVGQVSFANVSLGTRLRESGDILQVSRNLGFVWILSGRKSAVTPLLDIYVKGSHLVNEQSLVARVANKQVGHANTAQFTDYSNSTQSPFKDMVVDRARPAVSRNSRPIDLAERCHSRADQHAGLVDASPVTKPNPVVECLNWALSKAVRFVPNMGYCAISSSGVPSDGQGPCPVQRNAEPVRRNAQPLRGLLGKPVSLNGLHCQPGLTTGWRVSPRAASSFDCLLFESFPLRRRVQSHQEEQLSATALLQKPALAHFEASPGSHRRDFKATLGQEGFGYPTWAGPISMGRPSKPNPIPSASPLGGPWGHNDTVARVTHFYWLPSEQKSGQTGLAWVDSRYVGKGFSHGEIVWIDEQNLECHAIQAPQASLGQVSPSTVAPAPQGQDLSRKGWPSHPFSETPLGQGPGPLVGLATHGWPSNPSDGTPNPCEACEACEAIMLQGQQGNEVFVKTRATPQGRLADPTIATRGWAKTCSLHWHQLAEPPSNVLDQATRCQLLELIASNHRLKKVVSFRKEELVTIQGHHFACIEGERGGQSNKTNTTAAELGGQGTKVFTGQTNLPQFAFATRATNPLARNNAIGSLQSARLKVESRLEARGLYRAHGTNSSRFLNRFTSTSSPTGTAPPEQGRQRGTKDSLKNLQVSKGHPSKGQAVQRQRTLSKSAWLNGLGLVLHGLAKGRQCPDIEMSRSGEAWLHGLHLQIKPGWVYCPREQANLPGLHESIQFCSEDGFDNLRFEPSLIYLEAFGSRQFSYSTADNLLIARLKAQLLGLGFARRDMKQGRIETGRNATSTRKGSLLQHLATHAIDASIVREEDEAISSTNRWASHAPLYDLNRGSEQHFKRFVESKATSWPVGQEILLLLRKMLWLSQAFAPPLAGLNIGGSFLQTVLQRRASGGGLACHNQPNRRADLYQMLFIRNLVNREPFFCLRVFPVQIQVVTNQKARHLGIVSQLHNRLGQVTSAHTERLPCLNARKESRLGTAPEGWLEEDESQSRPTERPSLTGAGALSQGGFAERDRAPARSAERRARSAERPTPMGPVRPFGPKSELVRSKPHLAKGLLPLVQVEFLFPYSFTLGLTSSCFPASSQFKTLNKRAGIGAAPMHKLAIATWLNARRIVWSVLPTPQDWDWSQSLGWSTRQASQASPASQASQGFGVPSDGFGVPSDGQGPCPKGVPSDGQGPCPKGAPSDGGEAASSQYLWPQPRSASGNKLGKSWFFEPALTNPSLLVLIRKGHPYPLSMLEKSKAIFLRRHTLPEIPARERLLTPLIIRNTLAFSTKQSLTPLMWGSPDIRFHVAPLVPFEGFQTAFLPDPLYWIRFAGSLYPSPREKQGRQEPGSSSEEATVMSGFTPLRTWGERSFAMNAPQKALQASRWLGVPSDGFIETLNEMRTDGFNSPTNAWPRGSDAANKGALLSITDGVIPMVSPSAGEMVGQWGSPPRSGGGAEGRDIHGLGQQTKRQQATRGGDGNVLFTQADHASLASEGRSTKTCIGEFISIGDEVISGCATPTSGQIVAIEKNKITLRRTQPLLFYAQGVMHVNHGEWVEKNAPILTLTYQKLITGDIVQGIPKIEQFFEAPATKEGEPLSNSLQARLRRSFQRLKQLHPVPQAVKRSLEEIQQILVEGILKVYLSQGVRIADKHLEIVIRQMTSKGQVLDVGNTGLFQGEHVKLDRIERINLATYGQKADYEPAVLGITQASLDSESFISAASFQETTRVLSRDTITGKTDFLRGLKERVVLGDLIQAGTGLDDNINYGLLFGIAPLYDPGGEVVTKPL